MTINLFISILQVVILLKYNKMKTKKTISLSIEPTILKKAKQILKVPPKKSLSAFVEEKLFELIGKGGLKK